jgi:hypothetical protein
VADGWCWFVLREEYCSLVAGGWFVLRKKYCWLVADKPSEQAEHMLAPGSVPFGRADAGRRFTTQLLCDRAERRRSIDPDA